MTSPPHDPELLSRLREAFRLPPEMDDAQVLAQTAGTAQRQFVELHLACVRLGRELIAPLPDWMKPEPRQPKEP